MLSAHFYEIEALLWEIFDSHIFEVLANMYGDSKKNQYQFKFRVNLLLIFEHKIHNFGSQGTHLTMLLATI